MFRFACDIRVCRQSWHCRYGSNWNILFFNNGDNTSKHFVLIGFAAANTPEGRDVFLLHFSPQWQLSCHIHHLPMFVHPYSMLALHLWSSQQHFPFSFPDGRLCRSTKCPLSSGNSFKTKWVISTEVIWLSDIFLSLKLSTIAEKNKIMDCNLDI